MVWSNSGRHRVEWTDVSGAATIKSDYFEGNGSLLTGISAAASFAAVNQIHVTGSGALTGEVTLTPGTNITLAQLGQDITINSSASASFAAVNRINVTGSSALTGAVTLTPGANIALGQLGQDITITGTASGASPGASSGAIQFNANGVFGGDNNFQYVGSTNGLFNESSIGFLLDGSASGVGRICKANDYDFIDIIPDTTNRRGLRVYPNPDIFGTGDMFFQAKTGGGGYAVFEGYNGEGSGGTIMSSESSTPVILAPERTKTIYVKPAGMGVDIPNPDNKITCSGALSFVNISTMPTFTASSGGMFISSGALWFKSSGGTLTQLAPE